MMLRTNQCLKSFLNMPPKKLRNSEIKPPIHITKTICWTNNRLSGHLKYGMAHHRHILNILKSLLPGINQRLLKID
ncbi:hypothetical protein BGP_6504 [Beggiatoa sp. PS]|nr:hypothetical protein BGP_6504 [Beggiatoa sp. PS]